MSGNAQTTRADLDYRPAMSERSIYLRDQAEKCEWHARQMTSPETVAELRQLAADYNSEAADIESKEAAEGGLG